MNEYIKLEIMTEVAWQLGDTNGYIPHAESRWQCVDIALKLIDSGLIDENSVDIDETITIYLKNNGY